VRRNRRLPAKTGLSSIIGKGRLNAESGRTKPNNEELGEHVPDKPQIDLKAAVQSY